MQQCTLISQNIQKYKLINNLKTSYDSHLYNYVNIEKCIF